VVSSSDIHTHFLVIDHWIPPYDCYVEDENRPYQDDTLLEFRLVDGSEVPDTTGVEGGATGGINSQRPALPPIIFPERPIDTTVGTKVHGR
jgi:hypothetical protein